MKLEDVKLYLRIDGDEEDTLIQNMMRGGIYPVCCWRVR